MKTAVAASIQPGADFRSIPLDQIDRSPLNPRRTVTGDQLEELAASIREKGLLQPVLVRSLNGAGRYELVCGHRRFAAAQMVGLEELPAIVRELDDQAVLEIQVVENLQRADLHPLEEAESYRRLLLVKGYDVARIAEKIGRSVKYVYDRVKLLELTKEAKKLFLDGKISAGHATLLARLSPKDQARAIDLEESAVFTREALLWNPEAPEDEESEPVEHVKPRSVRELQGWIDQHVRFQPKDPDTMLFPETAATLADAKKVIPITHASYIADEAREGRTYFPRSWKRADGLNNSKPCEHAVIGYVAVGPGRGDAFAVCIAREKCMVHWGAEIRAKQKRTVAKAGKAGVTVKDQVAHEQAKRAEQDRRKHELQERYMKARPAILAAIGAKISTMSAESTGPLAKILLGVVSDRGVPKSNPVPLGRTAEDLVRHLVFLHACDNVAYDWNIDERLPAMAKSFGVDAAKILNEAAPVQTSAKAKRPAKKGRKK